MVIPVTENLFKNSEKWILVSMKFTSFVKKKKNSALVANKYEEQTVSKRESFWSKTFKRLVAKLVEF